MYEDIHVYYIIYVLYTCLPHSELNCIMIVVTVAIGGKRTREGGREGREGGRGGREGGRKGGEGVRVGVMEGGSQKTYKVKSSFQDGGLLSSSFLLNISVSIFSLPTATDTYTR